MSTFERTVAVVSVTALHVGLVAWVTSSLGHTPPKVVPPTIQGVLIPAEAPTPPQPLPTTPEPPAPPPPEPPPPEPPPPPPPEPPPPEPPKPKPEPKPKPKPKPPPAPPSEKAITVPDEAAEPPPAPPPVPPAASAPRSEQPPRPPSGPPGPPAEAPVTPPRVDASHLNNPAPQYPSLSRRMREEGRVLLDVHILPDGSVGEVRLRTTSGFRRLDDAAIAAVQRWRYVPARQGEKAIAYWYVQPIVFSLTQ